MNSLVEPNDLIDSYDHHMRFEHVLDGISAALAAGALTADAVALEARRVADTTSPSPTPATHHVEEPTALVSLHRRRSAMKSAGQ